MTEEESVVVASTNDEYTDSSEDEALDKKLHGFSVEEIAHIIIKYPPCENDWQIQCTAEELAVLVELKKCPEAQGVPDKYLMIFLLSRRCNLRRARDLLHANKAWRVQHGFFECLCFSALNMELARTMWLFKPMDTRDKLGRGIAYVVPRLFLPKKHTLQEQIAFCVWNWEYACREREGFILVADLTDLGWANFDMQSVRAIVSLFQNHFPGRIKQVLILNPPFWIRGTFSVAALFLKGKTLSREQLLEYIDRDQLITEYGGDLQYDHEKWVDQMYSEAEIGSAEKSHDVVGGSETAITINAITENDDLQNSTSNASPQVTYQGMDANSGT